MQDRSEKEVVQTKDDSEQTVSSDSDKENPTSEQDEADLKAQQLAELRAKREQELAKLERRLAKLRTLRQKMNDGLQENRSGILQIESQVGRLEQETVELEEAYKIKKKTLDLLPNAAANLKQLQVCLFFILSAMFDLNRCVDVFGCLVFFFLVGIESRQDQLAASLGSGTGMGAVPSSDRGRNPSEEIG